MSMPTNPEELELAGSAPQPSADAVAGRFALHPNPQAASTAEVKEILSNPGFGVHFTDHMARATWTQEKGWHDKQIVPYGPLSLDPAGAVLHYGQEVFEGLKAYKHADGSLWSFRPAYNGARLNFSSHRLAIPALPMEDFLGSVVDLVREDARWVPEEEGASLYLRPYIFASEAFLGVRAATRYEYLCIASPAGPYFEHGFQPINVWVEQKYHRAGPGGMGEVKTGGNYAASLLPKMHAAEENYDEVLFLDAATNKNLDEFGGMNVFVVYADGRVRTPRLTGNILPGNTRSSIIQLLQRDGVDVAEATLPLADVLAGIESGEVTEMFACGTAAVVTAVGSLTGEDFQAKLPSHEVAQSIYDELTGIQAGTAEDTFGWMYRIA
nr:branched-chain amino acid aminotransferase [Actinobaculum suis]